MVRTRAMARAAQAALLRDLPMELFLEIFNNLPFADQQSVHSTCRRFAELTDHDYFRAVYRNVERNYQAWLSSPQLRQQRPEPVKVLLDPVRGRNAEFVAKLLSHRATEPSLRDRQDLRLNIEKGVTIACENGQRRMVRLLLREWDPPFGFTDPSGRAWPSRRWLHIAAERGHDQVVRVLLERRYPVNATDVQGRTALELALENDHEDVVVRLLDRGADPEMVRRGRKVRLRQMMNGEVRRGKLGRNRYRPRGVQR